MASCGFSKNDRRSKKAKEAREKRGMDKRLSNKSNSEPVTPKPDQTFDRSSSEDSEKTVLVQPWALTFFQCLQDL